MSPCECVQTSLKPHHFHPPPLFFSSSEAANYLMTFSQDDCMVVLLKIGDYGKI